MEDFTVLAYVPPSPHSQQCQSCALVDPYKDDPPPYYMPNQQQYLQECYTPISAKFQQSTSPFTNVVAYSQPSPAISPLVVHPVGDHYLTVSIVLTIFCFLSGMWHSLLCTVPAIILAIMARKADAQGNALEAEKKERIAFFLDVVAILWWIITPIIVIIVSFAVLSVEK